MRKVAAAVLMVAAAAFAEVYPNSFFIGHRHSLLTFLFYSMPCGIIIYEKVKKYIRPKAL